MWQVWLIISGVLFILEIITTGFLVFWLAIGALFATVTSLITDSIIIQLIVFIASSCLLLYFTKPLVDKYINKQKTLPTNAYSIIGKKAIVLEEINSITGTGQIKVDGEVWSAKTLGDEIIAKGSEVEISSLDGVKACVKLIEKNQNSIIENKLD